MPLDSAAVPVITSVDPLTGPQEGGTTVTILGTGFTGTLGVYFGYNPNNFQAVDSVTFTVVSDTEITCTSPVSPLPLGSGLVDVVVQNANGFSALSEISTFLYQYDTGAFSTTAFTHTFLNADGSIAAGAVTFTLDDQMTNGTESVMATRFEAELSATGYILQKLISNVDTNTFPPPPWNTRWRVDFHITNASQRTFWIVVPAAPSTSVASGSSGQEIGSLTSNELQVASTTGFPPSGEICVTTSGGSAILAYTSVSSGSFNGISVVSGTGTWTVSTSAAVIPAVDLFLLIPPYPQVF